MKTKLICGALVLCMSGSVFGQRHHGGYRGNTAEIILGTALILGVTGAIVNSNRPPEVIIQQHAPVIQYNVQPPRLLPPYYDASAGVYIYTPPLAYNPRTGQWYRQNDIYIPQSQHYYGCNFYNQQDADACIERNQRHYGR